jgi:enoyl-CoA hydratase/carnithine racemase
MDQILLAGPGKNALGTDLMKRLDAALDALGPKPFLLRGDGDAFSAGLDLKEVASLDEPAMGAFLHRLDALLARLYTHPAPTVALVNGHAIAGGCILALACDHRVCTDNPRARLGLNEVALGLRFPPRIFRMVTQRVPQEHHTTVLLGAALHPPAEALRLGLVDEVSPEPEARARAVLAALAAHPAEGYAHTKSDLRAAVSTVSPEDLSRFQRETVPRWVAPELKARILAVLKR